MEIFVRCTIDEDLLQPALKELNWDESDFIQETSKRLNKNITETLDKYQELFSEVAWSINQPLF